MYFLVDFLYRVEHLIVLLAENILRIVNFAFAKDNKSEM